MDPYKLYTLTATKDSEITVIWNAMGIPPCAMLYEIEDALNHLFVTRKYVHVDASGVMTFRWPARDKSIIIASPSAFTKWFFTGVQTVASPYARPSTPIGEPVEQAIIDVDKIIAEFDVADI